MNHLARLVAILVAAMVLSGCPTAGGPTVCCELADGFRVVPRSQCRVSGGVPTRGRVCEQRGITPVPVVDSCEIFCGFVQRACPSDQRCLEACLLEFTPPPNPAIRCARQSQDCAGTATCWSWYTGTPR